MLPPLKALLRPRYATAALALLGAWEVWSFLAPPAPEIEPEKMRAADEAAATVAAAMPAGWRARKLFVAPLGRDGSGYVTGAVTRAVRRLDKVELADPPATEKIPAALAKLSGVEDLPDRTAALKVAREAGADLLMLGAVRELSLTDGVPKIALEVRVLDAETGSGVWERAVTWTPPFLARTVGLVSPMKRAIGWIIFVLLLPWAAVPIVKPVLRRESNAANAALVLGFAALSAVLAYLALAGELAGWAGAFFLLAVAFGFIYNAGVLNHVAGLRG